MGLSSRLRAVAACVPEDAAVADVGTDHAQLLAWLWGHGRIVRGIGIDVAEGPLRQARGTLAAVGLEGVELRRGDGLEPLQPGEVDTVVLAGMGGARMIRVVDAASELVGSVRRMVLQPNTDWRAVRAWIMAQRWELLDERMVEDRGKYYLVVVVRPRVGEVEVWSEDELMLGPRLLRTRSGEFSRWLRHELGRVERALTRASRGREPDGLRMKTLRAHGQRLTRALEG